MQKLVALLSIILMFGTHAKNIPFKKYSFSEGGYVLLGIISKSDKSSLQDSIGNFYITDTSTLRKIQESWIFNEASPKYACGYHYYIHICKNGISLESFAVNINCKEIITPEGAFKFNPELLRSLWGKFKKPKIFETKFSTIDEARNYRMKLEKDSTLLYFTAPPWHLYEGSFNFEYTCKNNKDCKYEFRDITFNKIKTEIEKNYPTEKFELNIFGSSTSSLQFRITCNQSLKNTFSLYEYQENNSWEFLNLSIKSYHLK